MTKDTISTSGFLVDKFGKYKPVVVMSLILNAVCHHSLMMIPQQEIPGKTFMYNECCFAIQAL